MRLSGKRIICQAEGAGSSKDPEVGCQVGVCQACCRFCSCNVARIAGKEQMVTRTRDWRENARSECSRLRGRGGDLDLHPE